MTHAHLTKLYEWKMIDKKVNAADDRCFLDFEKRLAEIGIRTRVKPSQEGRGYELWVPLKDYEVVHALYTGEVKEIIDFPTELYHEFDKDLSFKNKILYEDRFGKGIKKVRYRSYLYLAAILIVMLLIFRFVKFP